MESVGLVGTRPSTTLRRSRQMEHTACLSHVCYHSCFLWSHFTPPIVTNHDADDIKMAEVRPALAKYSRLLPAMFRMDGR